MPDLSFLSERAIVHKSYKIYVDITYSEGSFILGQRLNSFFGQTGIYEGGDKIVKAVEDFLNFSFFDFLNFDEDEDISKEMLHIENDFFHEDFYEKDYVLENTDNYVFYLPVFLIFYRGDKKMDFFLLNTFKKNYFVKKQRFNIVSFYWKYILENNNFFKNSIDFSKVFNYIKNIKIFSNYFYFKKKISLFKKKTIIDYVIMEDSFWDLESDYFQILKKRKKRIYFFKKYFIKNKMKLFLIYKSLRWIEYKMIFDFILFKFYFLDIKFVYSVFKKNFLSLISFIYHLKKKFLRKYRRRKKFKRLIYRNFLGKKFTFEKVTFYQKTKKKKR